MHTLKVTYIVLVYDSLVMGSKQWPLLKVDVYGSLRADGQSYSKVVDVHNSLLGGLGGGSGGTILAFLQALKLVKNATMSAVGGNGGDFGGGGGGGGRIHFHWSIINKGDEYVPLAVIGGDINNRFVAASSLIFLVCIRGACLFY